MSPTPVLAFLGRVLMSLIFIADGVGKFSGETGTVRYIASVGLPWPETAYWIAVAVEAGGGLAILVGLFTRPAAAALAGFCLITALIFHFVPGDQNQMVNFFKNICMAGGFLQLAAFGAGQLSLDALRARRPA